MTATGRDARVGNHAVQVFRGGWGLPERVGPFEGLRAGPLLVYVLPLPDDFAPWPGRPRADTVLVDLSLGVSMSRPCWQWRIRPDGRRTPGLDAERAEPATWYVDLVSVSPLSDTRIDVVDQFIDLMVPTDGRQARMLDLDEFGDALEVGDLTPAQAADGLRRWQRFLDTYIYATRDPRHGYAEFPPTRFADLVSELAGSRP